MKPNRNLILVLTLSGLLLFNNCNQISHTKTIKLAHGVDINHSVHKAMLKMGEDLSKISVGIF
jgi:TRAP-type C4-dicarboxylate transport system substrate-binding protein